MATIYFNCIKKQSGYALLIVLLILQIFSLYALLLMKVDFYHQSITRSAAKTSLQQHLAYQALEAVESQPFPANCQQTHIVQLASRPYKWWQQYTCHDTLNSVTYFYFWEDLGTAACGRMAEGNQQDKAGLLSHYARVSLLFAASNAHDDGVLLQSTIAQGATAVDAACQATTYAVQPGRQMLRELIRRVTFE